MTKTAILYLRVSTEEQAKSGLGLAAQKEEATRFAEANGYMVLGIFEEHASGKLGLADRPQLNAAIRKCLKDGATLLVAKLCRLSRDAAFVMNLMQTKVKFVVAALGEHVADVMIHMLCVFNQYEREMIAKRTKDALTALKAKGVVLGNKKNFNVAQSNGNATVAKKADEFAEKMRPSITRMQLSGMSMRAIADEFNMNGTKTYTGTGKWSAKSICNITARWK